jgi:uncharacterized membrane protein YhaH (DUF805 family)
MTFQQAILTCLRKYFTFSGRASRSEYWWFFLFCLLGGAISGALEGFINGITRTPNGPTLISGAFNLATFIPGLAVGWRRMHDSGRSGLYLLYPLIAIAGLVTFAGLFAPDDMASGGEIILPGGLIGAVLVFAGVIVALSPFLVLWWLTRPSQPGPNQYGPNPHEVHI